MSFDSLVIMKHSLQSLQIILGTTCLLIYLARSNLQPHNSALPGAQGGLTINQLLLVDI